MDTILPILKKLPLFADLTQDEHRQIIEQIVMNYYPVGHVFFHEGDEAGGMYIIKHGMVKISAKNGGEDKDLATLVDNGFFGEMGLISDKPRNATATALSDCEVFELSKDNFYRAMESLPHLSEKVSKTYLDREKQNGPPPENEI